jgi:hypothetical protein
MARKKEENLRDEWELEEEFDAAASLSELINEPPFKEASDEGGNSHTAGARIPMWLYRRVIKLREQSGSPYDIDSDVIRDAIYIGLRVLNMRHKTNPDWDVESKMAAIVDASSAAKRLKDQVTTFAIGLQDLMDDKDYDRATHGLINYVSALSEMQSQWQRHRLFGMLKQNKTIQELAKNYAKHIWSIIEKEAEESANT